MRKAIYCVVILSLFMNGCSRSLDVPELHPLSKHGDFYVGARADGKTVYLDFKSGELNIIDSGRAALEKYSCETPKLLASAYNSDEVLSSGIKISGENGIALGNLYITDTEILTFNFITLELIERIPLKKTGVIRISNYDVFVAKRDFLYAAVNDISEYKVSIDSKENPTLYKDDRIVYYDDEQILIKNTSNLYEEPISFKDYYERFVQDQARVDLLRTSNDLNDVICLICEENICFIVESGHLLFSR